MFETLRSDASMRRLIILFIALSLGLTWACVPKLPLPPLLEPTPPPEVETIDYYEVYLEAESLFAEQFFEEALERYNFYFANHPEGACADRVLSRIGEIHTYFGEEASAREAFTLLLEKYPHSDLVPATMIAILETYDREESYEDVVRYSFEIPDEQLTPELRQRKESLLGDAYLATGSPVDAFYFYSLVYDQSPEPAKPSHLQKLKDVLPYLNIMNTTYLLDRLKDEALRGYLLYHLGLLTLEIGRTDDALAAFSELVSRHAAHEQAGQAKALIREIISESISSPHTIGCLLPLSGPYKVYGNKALQGIELALNEYHRAHPKKPVNLIVKDTASEHFQAVKAVKALDDANVSAIVGPIVASEPAAMEAQSRGIPIVIFTQKENVAQIGEFVFRNFMTPRMQAKALATYAVREMKLKRFVILHPDENYGDTYMNLFWDEVVALGGDIVGVETYDPMATDFATPVKKLVGLYYTVPEALKVVFNFEPQTNEETDPRISTAMDMFAYMPIEIRQIEDVYFWGHPLEMGPLSKGDQRGRKRDDDMAPIVDFGALFIPDAAKKAGLIIPQLAYYDIENVVLLGTNLWHSQQLINMSREYIQDAVLTDGFFADSNKSNVKTFSKNFKATFDQQPGFIEAVAYDTAKILLQTLLNQRIRFRSHLKDELLSLVEFPGVTGATSFDYKGDAIKAPYILGVKGRSFEELRAP